MRGKRRIKGGKRERKATERGRKKGNKKKERKGMENGKRIGERKKEGRGKGGQKKEGAEARLQPFCSSRKA